MRNNYDGSRFYDPDYPKPRNSARNTIFFGLFWYFKYREQGIWPKKIPLKSLDKPPVKILGNDLRVSNVGHVTFLIQTQGLNILTDPVWSERASPFKFIGPKRVVEPGIKFEDLPPIDIILISHNHYDHLDIDTIKRLWNRSSSKPKIITPLGNDLVIKRHIPSVEIETYNWGESTSHKAVKIHIEPMQHWSARGLFDKNKALWAAFTIETSGGNIYFIGDSGYGKGRYFKAAREKFESFRLALLPIGAYKPRELMEYSHMTPEEMVLAHMDLNSKYTVPSHYDVFRLASESYGDAEKELKLAKARFNIEENIHIVKIGTSWLVP